MHEEIRVRDSNGGGHNDIVTLISSEYHIQICVQMWSRTGAAFMQLCESFQTKKESSKLPY